ncbi:protein Son-like [Salvelinus sp. IW2-2015]|uniref:protein Son-like n=1 Tax=Salvelinus sp. IW2-2015 TaxID=2691554 RepID=UPI000CEAF409|nr:protein SON-like [Salvelinus alpinus]
MKAQKRLAENPYDVSAICMLSRAQEQVDAWAQSNTIPGLFTGSTGATVLSSEELSNSGPQAWIKKVPSTVLPAPHPKHTTPLPYRCLHRPCPLVYPLHKPSSACSLITTQP